MVKIMTRWLGLIGVHLFRLALIGVHVFHLALISVHVFHPALNAGAERGSERRIEIGIAVDLAPDSQKTI